MKNILKQCIYFIGSFGLAILLIREVVVPVLSSYSRLERMMTRFPYTDEVLILFAGLGIWLFCLQWQNKKLSVIYLYLFYSIYIFFLFIVLFTKAATYHTFTLDPFDFLQPNKYVLAEAAMNLVYFIPLGVLYHVKANRWQFTVIALLTILGIESIQYVFYIGTFALSDILLNFLGCVCGYALYGKLKQRLDA